MRLVTRADFDGLACGTILMRKGIIDDFLFIHPRNIQSDECEITCDDVLTNVPFDERAGLWFDHHSSEVKRVNPEGKFWGMCDPTAPSCARLVYNFYDGEQEMPDLAEMIKEVDRVDSANLTMEDVLNPQKWVLLGFICDPRTGLGRFHGFEISNRDLMQLCMQDLCSHGDIDYVMSNKHIKARIDMYNEQQKLFEDMVHKTTTVDHGVIVTDLREQAIIYTGNRFKVYAMYPEAKVSVTLMKNKGNTGCAMAVGQSIFNKFDFDIGDLMLEYGGGGHKHVGTCQFENMYDPAIDEIIRTISDATGV